MRSEHMKLVLIAVGLAALIFVGHRVTRDLRFESARKRGKKKIETDEVSREVICDACDAVSPTSVPYKEQSQYKECPACGEVAARPIIYYVCGGRECERQLVRTPAGVVVDKRMSFRPGTDATCPLCRNPQNLSPMALHYADAEKTAKETDQEFP